LETVASMIAFVALVASWFVLPSAPRQTAAAAHVPSETLVPAA
jgi:hypothetical protein